MQPYTLFVADPEIAPECQSAIALARQHDIPIRKIDAGSIDQIQEQFGDAFPGVPALYAEGQNTPFLIGTAAIARKLQGQGSGGADRAGSGLPPIPAKDTPDGAVRN